MKKCCHKAADPGREPHRLSDVKAGKCCVISGFCGCEKSACELQRMGLLAGDVVRVIRTGACMMIECGGCRLALRQEVGRLVTVCDPDNLRAA